MAQSQFIRYEKSGTYSRNSCHLCDPTIITMFSTVSTGLYLDSAKSSRIATSYIFKIKSNIIILSLHVFPMHFFPSGFPAEGLHVFLIFMQLACAATFTFFDLIII